MKKNYLEKYIYLLLLLLLFANRGLAQQKIFTGTINDKTGYPVADALVSIKEHPEIKVFTDKDGKFSISGEAGQLLEVTTREQSYKTYRIETDQIVITIDDGDDLIPIGFGMKLRKEEVTSAIGIVKADELTKSSVFNPLNALYGKIPGLFVLQNGGIDWNTDPSLYIRGVETFGIGSFVNTNILLLVDGFERPLSSLSLAEIESVAILKDAAALAMYGLRGANGVMLVTTKRGTGKGLSVNVNYEHGITKAFRLPDFLNAYDYANAVNQARSNDGLTPLYSQPELNRFQSGSSPFLYPNVNWENVSLKDYGFSNKFNITFQQQSSAVRYFTEINYDEEEGLFGPVNNNEGYSTQSTGRKFNFRTNLDMDLTRTTKFEINIAGNLGQYSRPGTANSEDDIISAIYNTPSAAYPVTTPYPVNRTKKYWGGTSSYKNNPVALISSDGYILTGKRELMTDFFLEQKLDKVLKGLSAEAGLSADRSFNYRDSKTQQFLYNQFTPVLDPVTYAITDTTSILYGSNTSLSYATSVPSLWSRLTFLADLKYTKDWADNELRSVLLFQREELIINGQNNTFRHLLGAGNVHYGKAGKYFVDLTLSYSGTNLLPKGKQFGFFPALSLAWKLSNEEWLKGSSVFNDLKLRASWGMSGNDQVIQNLDLNPWTYTTTALFGSNNTVNYGVSQGRPASSPLTFETSYKSNIGIDASLFNMLDLNLDVFYDKRKGILVETGGSISPVLGVSSPYSSSGITTNKGIELGLNIHKSIADFNYNVGGQLSYTKSKIIEMNEIYRPYDYLKRTGQEINQAFGLQAIGFFLDGPDIADSPKQTFSIVRPGDIKYKDQNDDDIINAFDEVPIGYNTRVPEIYYSGSVGIEYKGFGIDAFLQGVANYTVYLNTSSIFWPLVNNTNISTYSDNAWTPATAATATLPRLTTASNDNNFRPNSIWFANGSYLKLRTAELYYKLPKQLLSRLKVNEARLYVRGMNLLSIDKIKVVDPEAIGITYPTVSSYNVGIQIGF